ncbi:MAG TPA: tetratricopeptide repeat protein [Verrucomicrobiae bacterium]|nr:tetratricopeptide repeat protein [Verrucomicrobiae bacterium]
MTRNRRWIFIATFVAAGLAAAGWGAARWQSAQAQQRLQSRFDRADAALAAQHLEAAFLEFQALAELQPAEPRAWRGLAQTWLAAGMPASAENAATRVIELQRARPLAADYLLRARSRTVLGRNHGAAFDAKRAFALEPGNVEAAQIAQAAARAPPATQPPPPVAPVDAFWPPRLAAVVREVVQRLQRQDWSGAREVADAAERDHPDAMIGPWLAGIVAYAHGQYGDAETRLQLARLRAPRSSRVATNLAGAWAKQQGPAYAAQRLLELHERDPGFLVPLDIAATAYLELRQPAQAQQALERGIAAGDAPALAYLQLAQFHRALDRPAEALRACEDGLARWPVDAALGLCRAQALAASGDTASAVTEYEALLAQRPDALEARIDLARLLAAREDSASLARALQLARSLQADAPAGAEAFDAIGWTLLRSGDASAARPWLEAAAQAAPSTPTLRYHHGVALARLGQRAAARAELRAALETSGPYAERPDAQRLLNSLGG